MALAGAYQSEHTIEQLPSMFNLGILIAFLRPGILFVSNVVAGGYSVPHPCADFDVNLDIRVFLVLEWPIKA